MPYFIKKLNNSAKNVKKILNFVRKLEYPNVMYALI